jgi:regulator of replication initiation timing
MAQQPAQQQATPQQTVNALVTQQAQLTSQIITVLNQIPTLVEQNQALTKQIADLQKELDALKAAQKKVEKK